jgi:hypothetical protein
MQVTAEEELADLFCACLRELDEIEAAFIEDCCLREPKMQLRDFSKRWGFSAKALIEVRNRALDRLKDEMARKGITSLADII